jgi:hypothetical protein
MSVPTLNLAASGSGAMAPLCHIERLGRTLPEVYCST